MKINELTASVAGVNDGELVVTIYAKFEDEDGNRMTAAYEGILGEESCTFCVHDGWFDPSDPGDDSLVEEISDIEEARESEYAKVYEAMISVEDALLEIRKG